jgi:hypothetical protein
LAIDGVKVFFNKLGFCGSHRLAGTVISLACVHIMFTVLRRTLAGEENLVDVETDSSYNNRPQPGCEAATQTFCPLVEQCTKKKLTINIETANVNCPSKNFAKQDMIF